MNHPIKHLQNLLGLLFPLGNLQAADVITANTNFISSAAALHERMQRELNVTKPDFVVFVPSVTDTNVNDTGNEHFLVFDGADGSLMAVWTQSSAESQPDQHITFARSADEGHTWSRPRIIAGPNKPGAGPIASWGYHRRPVYLVPGRFQPGADQPIWFEEPRFFMDHNGVSLGKPGTQGRLDLALYASFTVRRGQAVLWYPDRKFFLLGRVIGQEWFLPVNLHHP